MEGAHPPGSDDTHTQFFRPAASSLQPVQVRPNALEAVHRPTLLHSLEGLRPPPSARVAR